MKAIKITFMLLAMAGAALFSGCGDLEPQDTLLFFYDDYLSLTCSEHGTPDYEKVQACLQRYLSPRAYDELQRRRDVDRDDWLDYDIFIQGQDCWPGIHLESIIMTESSDWYDVTIALPDYNNRDSIAERKHVFFYMEKGDHGWQIGAVDDHHNRIGSAPRKDEAALKRRQWKILFEEGVRWKEYYDEQTAQLLEREADYNNRLTKAAEQIAQGVTLTDFELCADIPTSRDRYLVFWLENDELNSNGTLEQKERYRLIDSVAVLRAAGGCTPLLERYVGMLEWADGWPAEYIYEGVSYLRHVHPADVDAAIDSLFPDKEWLKEEIKDHQQWFENNSTDKKWKK